MRRMPRGRVRTHSPEEVMAHMVDPNTTIKNSPFGTTHTSKLRYRIVGSKLMPVVEDNIYPQPLTGREDAEVRHRQIPEKPNHIWPSHIQPPFAQEDPALRHSMSGDKFYETLGHVSKPQNDPLHPFSVLPPVRADQSPYSPEDLGNSGYDGMLQEMVRRLPNSRLPNEPLRFSAGEVSYLMQKMHQELEGYVTQRLKDIYVEMTTFDRKLSGLIHFDDFVFAARKHQLKCDPALLRLVASMFVVPSTPNFVNYEKILSFIGAALKSDQSSMMSPHSMPPQHFESSNRRQAYDPNRVPHVEPHEGWSSTPRSIGLRTASKFGDTGRQNHLQLQQQQQQQQQHQQQLPPQFSQSQGLGFPPEMTEVKPHIQVPPAAPMKQPAQQSLHGANDLRDQKRRLEIEGNQAKLLSILHEALHDYSREDFNRLVDAFYLWDREKKGTLTVDDIKTVAYRQNLQVTNSVINALLDMCYVRWDQYDWRKFVKYIEAALPSAVMQDPGTSKQEQPREAAVPSHTQTKQLAPPENTSKQKYSPRSGADSPSDAARAWFDRFMRLSKALYTVDSKYVGHLPPDDVRWVTNEYNRVYELGLYEHDVEEAINVSSTHSGMVNIDSYLRSLSLRGHF